MAEEFVGARSDDADPIPKPSPPSTIPPRSLDTAGLQSLIDTLVVRGYTVIGPTVRGRDRERTDRTIDDLPRGWGDEQDAAHYRLRRRDDDALFGFAAGAQSANRSSSRPTSCCGGSPRPRRVHRARESERRRQRGAMGRLRTPCSASGPATCTRIAIHDQVLHRPAARRTPTTRPDGEDAFIVVGRAAPTPAARASASRWAPARARRASRGFDLSLTELLDGGSTGSLVEVGTRPRRRGAGGMPRRAGHRPTTWPTADRGRRSGAAAGWAGSSTPTDIKDLLYAERGAARAGTTSRRGACRAATARWSARPASAPSVEDHTDLTGDGRPEHRVWDSCFTGDFSYICTAGTSGPRRVALPAVDDAQARLLARPVRHVGLRRLRPLRHLVPGRDRHHRGGRRDPRRTRGGSSTRELRVQTVAQTFRSTRSSPASTRRRRPARRLRAQRALPARASTSSARATPADHFFVVRHGRVALDVHMPGRRGSVLDTVEDGRRRRLVVAGAAVPLVLRRAAP